MNLFSPVLAMIGNPVVTGGDAPVGTTFIGEFIPRMITIIFVIGSLAFFFMFLIGAVRWILSGGDKAVVEGARAQITQAVAGLFVMIAVWAVSKLLQAVFGINLLNIDLTPILPTGTP